MFEKLCFRFQYTENQGSISYDGSPAAGVSAGVAINGLSVSGSNIILGQAIGTGGDPAKLLFNTEIPMNGVYLSFRDLGTTTTSYLLLKSSATVAYTTPSMVWQSSAGVEWSRINFNQGDIFIGYHAGIGTTNVALSANTVIGYNAGAGVMTTTGNTLVGFYAGNAVTSAANVTAFGSGALQVMTTGSNNTALGYQALTNLASGSDNTAVGWNAGASMGAGSTQNTLVGRGAGYQSITHGAVTGTVIIGYNTNLQGVAGNYDIMIGTNTYFSNASTSGGTNILLGYNIVSGGNPIGQNNVIVGSNINSAALTVGNGNIWIGTGNGSWASGVANTTVVATGMNIVASNVCYIGISTQNIIIGGVAAGSTDNGSKLQVLGSISLPITTFTTTGTLDATMHTVIFTGAAPVATLPTAASSSGRVYFIVNQNTAGTTSINYLNFAGTSVNALAANSVTALQSNGTNWYRIV